MITILVVDGQPAIRKGLRMWLSLEADFKVVGEAASQAEAVQLAISLQPVIIVLDAEITGKKSIETVKLLQQAVPHSNVIMLSIYQNISIKYEAYAAGVFAFFTKINDHDTLISTIRAAANQATILP